MRDRLAEAHSVLLDAGRCSGRMQPALGLKEFTALCSRSRPTQSERCVLIPGARLSRGLGVSLGDRNTGVFSKNPNCFLGG